MWELEQAREEGAIHAQQNMDLIKDLRNVEPRPFLVYLEAYRKSLGISNGKRFSLPNFSSPISLPRIGKLPIYISITLLLGYGTAYAASYIAPDVVEKIAVSAVKAFLDPERAALTKAGVNCATRLRVSDRDSKQQGYLAPFVADCKIQQSSHRSSPVTKGAEIKLSNAYRVLEGSYFGNGSILGFHLETPYRIAISLGKHGGSTPLETAQKNANGKGGSLSKWEKVQSIATLPTTSALLYPTKANRDKFVANNLPCITGLSGSGLGGVLAGDFCGQIFGRASLGDPTWMEACKVAAAGKYPVKIYSNDNATPDRLFRQSILQEITWRKSIHRTKNCLQLLAEQGIIQDSELKDGIRAADQLVPPAPRARGFYNPDNKLSKNLPNLKIAASQIDEDTITKGSLSLNIDSDFQREIGVSFQKYLPKLLKRTDPKICLGQDCLDSKQLDYAFQVVEIDGSSMDVLARYETRYNLLSGPSNTLVTRSIASLNKVSALTVIANAGIKKVCLKPTLGLNDPIPSGFSGSNDCKRYTKSMDWITGYSSNIGIANALTKVDAKTLENFLLKVGYRIVTNGSKAELIRGTTVGNSVVIQPDKFIQMVSALATDGTSNAPELYIGQPSNFLDLSAEMSNATRKVTKKWLSNTLKYGRTASSLGAKLESNDCKSSFAKTGSSDSPVPKKWRDKLIVFSTHCGGRHFIGFAMIGSPDINVALGNIHTSHVVNTFWPAFENLIRKGK